MQSTFALHALDYDKSICTNLDAEQKQAKAAEIKDFYPKLMNFYTELKKASPETKIFVIGYPRFYESTVKDCTSHFALGNITVADRKTINEFVALANAVIKNAALDSGLKFIDIESALGDTALCGKSTSVNDIKSEFIKGVQTAIMKSNADERSLSDSLENHEIDSTIAAYADYYRKTLDADGGYVADRARDPNAVLNSIMQELVHPNANGHQLIYERISDGLGADGLYSVACNKIVLCPDGSKRGAPAISDFVTNVQPPTGIEYHDAGGKISVSYRLKQGVTIEGALERDGRVTITFDSRWIGFTDTIVGVPIVTIHSTPVELGPMTAQPDGTYQIEVEKLPQGIRAGWHTVHLTGKLTSGRNYDVYQSVFIRGPEGDYDDDGVADSADTCAFSKPSGKVNNDGTDVSCSLVTIPKDGAAQSVGGHPIREAEWSSAQVLGAVAGEPSGNLVFAAQFNGSPYAADGKYSSRTPFTEPALLDSAHGEIKQSASVARADDSVRMPIRILGSFLSILIIAYLFIKHKI